MWQKSALSMWAAGCAAFYAAGVFDWCLENGVKFDYGIGISAGSANLASLSERPARAELPVL